MEPPLGLQASGGITNLYVKVGSPMGRSVTGQSQLLIPTMNALAGAKHTMVATLLVAGMFMVLTLWAAFCFDDTSTRNLYFNVAMIHVLTEIPFLLRVL